MKSTTAALLTTILLCAAQIVAAQGAPSPAGQAETPEAASSAEHAVQSRHDKLVAHSKSRAAKRAAKAASSASQ